MTTSPSQPDRDPASRRGFLKRTAQTAAVAALAGGVASAAGDRAPENDIRFDNAQFYNAAGEFDLERAKDAVMALCRYHGYPIFPGLREKLWVSDYKIGQFTTLGLAAYIFVNNVADRYMLMDIFLLPGQMLPEHWHEAGEGNPSKREGWVVRWGLSHIVGVGEPNLGPDVVVPSCHWNGQVTVRHEVVATPGMFVPLAEVDSRHWQLAGPEGAILSEVANVHTGSAVRHTDPVLDANFRAG